MNLIFFPSSQPIDTKTIKKETVTLLKGGDDFNINIGIKTLKQSLSDNIEIKVIRSLDFLDDCETLIIFSHGSEDGIIINGILIDWKEFSQLILSSEANEIYVASCYSANVYNYVKFSEKMIIGWKEINDAMMMAYLTAYFINYEFGNIEDTNLNLDDLKHRVNYLSLYPESTVPLLSVAMQEINYPPFWSSYRFNMLFNEFEVPKVELITEYALEEMFEKFFDQIFDDIITAILGEAISWWYDIFLLAVFLNILFFDLAFSLSKDSFDGKAAWVSYEVVGWPPVFPPAGVWVQGWDPYGTLLFDMYCPGTLLSPQLLVIYLLFMWLYNEFPQAHNWYPIDLNFADVEVKSFPSHISAIPCSSQNICFSLKNVGILPAFYEFEVENLPMEYYDEIPIVFLWPGESKNICLNLDIPCYAPICHSFDFTIKVAYQPCPVQPKVVKKVIHSSLHIDDKLAPDFEAHDKTIYDNETFAYYVDILNSAGAERVTASLYYNDALVEENEYPIVTNLDSFKRYNFTFTKPMQLGDYDIIINAYCPWGNYRSKNAIIHYLDDDELGPEIIITPFTQNVTDGDSTISFSVDATDISDISVLNIKFNDNLIGTTPGTYVIDNPKDLGVYSIVVESIDNDTDRGEIDKAIRIEFASVVILDDDTTPPNITIDYFGSENDGDPGVWDVFIEDLQSGIYEINVTIDDFLIGHCGGIYPVNNSLGLHTIIVNASNLDFDRGIIDQEVSSLYSIIYITDDDIEAPIVSDFLIIDNILEIVIDLEASDFYSGDDKGISKIEIFIDGILVETYYNIDPNQNNFNIVIPNNWIMQLGLHEVKIKVWDADNDRIGDSMYSIVEGEFEISLGEILVFIIWEINQLNNKIQDSPLDCWKNKNNKNTMSNKLNELIALVLGGEYNEAYNKLLHDIKPKLTGLKTDENEIPWDGGIFKNPWVICLGLQESLLGDCNLILKHIRTVINIS